MKTKVARIKPAQEYHLAAHHDGSYALYAGKKGSGQVLAQAWYPLHGTPQFDAKNDAIKRLRDYGIKLGLTAIWFGQDNLLEGK